MTEADLDNMIDAGIKAFDPTHDTCDRWGCGQSGCERVQLKKFLIAALKSMPRPERK